MRTPSLVITGLGVSLGMILLNTQEFSLAGSPAAASTETGASGVEAAMLLSMDIPAPAPVERRESSAPARPAPTKAAAAPAPVVAPKQRKPELLAAIAKADMKESQKEIVNQVLMSLPPKCRDTLQDFYVKYTKQKSRGLAGRSVMILDGTVPDEEFRALFIHESGHNWDLGCLRGTPDAGKSAFSDGDEAIYKDDPSIGFYRISWITSSVQRSESSPEDFVSGYAASDVFEDFAESFAYFVLQNNVFATRAKTNAAIAKKYAWFRDVLFDGVVPQIATGKSVYNGKAPWDVTKLDYSWHPRSNVVAQQ